LVQRGVVINGIRVEYDSLSSDFIEYHIRGTQKNYGTKKRLVLKKLDKTRYREKKQNLIQRGVSIDGIRVEYDSLSSDFIEYHIRGTQKKYCNP
jgi:hypothetical protein